MTSSRLLRKKYGPIALVVHSFFRFHYIFLLDLFSSWLFQLQGYWTLLDQLVLFFFDRHISCGRPMSLFHWRRGLLSTPRRLRGSPVGPNRNNNSRLFVLNTDGSASSSRVNSSFRLFDQVCLQRHSHSTHTHTGTHTQPVNRKGNSCIFALGSFWISSILFY